MMRTLAIMLVAVTAISAAAQPEQPRFSAKLHAAHEAVAPGGRTELAVEVRIEPGWHIYHPALDTGFPTVISFDAPEGVQVGEVRFPKPHLAKSPVGEFLELSGRVVFLAPLTIGPDVKPGSSLKVTANISALACKEMCLPVQASVSLTLAVSAEMGKAANQKFFEEARAAMPPSLVGAPYIKGSGVSIEPDSLTIHESAEAKFTIKVERGHHIQDPDPGVEGLIPSRLFIEKLDGVTIDEPVWPEPHVREMTGIGKVREQSGEVSVRVPLKITDEKFVSGPVRLHVLLQYQCCTDAGQCYPPEMAEGFIEFVADTPNAPAATAVAQASGGAAAAESPGRAATEVGGGLWKFAVMVVFGFLGGLILNITPCVLPVVSIKVLSFVQQAGEDPKRVFRLGLAFCAGIMVWFWLFAALSAFGNVPMQSPAVVLAVGSIVFVLALSLLGVFEIMLPGAATGKLDEATRREGYSGSFFKGLLATLLGTACTAPFLATALAYTFTQPTIVGFLIFSSAGLGMSSPYLLLSANPGWLKFVPKPGPWMVTFKQVMGFVLLGTTVWLLTILEGLLGGDGAVWTVGFWGFLALAVWLFGKAKPTWETASRVTAWVAAIAIVLVGWWFSFTVMFDWRSATIVPDENVVEIDPAVVEATIAAAAASDWSGHTPWQPWRPGGLAAALARRGYTVYVDYTADWCPSCKANKYGWLETEAMRAKMRELRVIPIEADFTRRNPAMHAEIKSWGNPTVPLNLVYPAGRPEDAVKLPTVFVSGDPIHEALDNAGPSRKFPSSASPGSADGGAMSSVTNAPGGT